MFLFWQVHGERAPLPKHALDSDLPGVKMGDQVAFREGKVDKFAPALDACDGLLPQSSLELTGVRLLHDFLPMYFR